MQNAHPKKISWLLAVVSNATLIALQRYRLAEERRWIILIFDHFRFATLKQLLHIAITTADCGRLYKLLYVVLDASILFPSNDIAVHENANTLIEAAILKSGHNRVDDPSKRCLGGQISHTFLCASGDPL